MMVNGKVDLFGKTITMVYDNSEGPIVVLTSTVYCMISDYERIIKRINENDIINNRDVTYFKEEFYKLRKQLTDGYFTYTAECRSGALSSDRTKDDPSVRFLYTRYDVVSKLVKIIVNMDHEDETFIQPLINYYSLIMSDLIVYSALLKFNNYLTIICNDIKTLYSKFNKSLNLDDLTSNFKQQELRYNNSYHILKQIDEDIKRDRNNIKITISINHQ